jgi:hypothetical protein
VRIGEERRLRRRVWDRHVAPEWVCTATLLLYRNHKQSGGFEISGTRAESLTFPNHKGNQVYWDDFNGCREVLMGKTGAERFQGYLLML